MACRIRSSFLQSVWSHTPQQAEETAAIGASLQPLRGTKRLENLQSFQTTLVFSEGPHKLQVSDTDAEQNIKFMLLAKWRITWTEAKNVL